MNKLQLLDQQNQIQDKIKELISKGENEVRKLTDDENSELTNLKLELASVVDKLKEITGNEARASKTTNSNLLIINKTNQMEKFSLLKAIDNEVNRRSHSDEINAVMDAGRAELRKSSLEYKGGIVLPMEYRGDIVAASNAVVGKETMSVIEPLSANLVAVKAGATLMNGLIGSISIPTYSGTTSAWADENGSASDGSGSFGSVTMAPKRLTTYLAVSKQFLIQDSAQAEAMLMKDIVDSISTKLEATIFGKDSTATNKPDGFYTGTVTYTSTGSASWAKVVALEGAVDTANALQGNLAYIVHPSLKSTLKTTAKASGAAVFIYEGNTINGYNAFATSNIASGLQAGTDEYGIIFGNFADLVIGQWGALDITVDPYSLAGDGKVKLIINSYWDVKKRRTASFALGSLK